MSYSPQYREAGVDGLLRAGTLVNILFGGLIAVACEYAVTRWR